MLRQCYNRGCGDKYKPAENKQGELPTYAIAGLLLLFTVFQLNIMLLFGAEHNKSLCDVEVRLMNLIQL